jgi:hypothetical protein
MSLPTPPTRVRRARKLRLRLGGDPADDEYPDKPPRMRWATYNRLTGVLAARLLGKINPKANERVRNKSNRTTTKGKWHYSAFAPLVGAKRTSISVVDL